MVILSQQQPKQRTLSRSENQKTTLEKVVFDPGLGHWVAFKRQR